MKTAPEIFHQEILSGLKKYSGQGTKHSGNAAYLGNDHLSYHISNPLKRKIALQFVRTHRDISFQDFLALLDLLYASESHDEKSIAGMPIGYYALHRRSIKPESLDSWLNDLKGWAEIDSLCQSNFTAEEMLSNWKEWNFFLVKVSKDKHISKRRASLVLLTGPVSKSDDSRLFGVALKNIDRLKAEKDILITKAISWLLRSSVRYHKKEIIAYIKRNTNSLPKIALRETRRKILTGRK
jgi:3-methyladenine DNA glycosylase AlkD